MADDLARGVPVRTVCDKCGERESLHLSALENRHLCCECYVGEGNPPADWHEACLNAAELKKVQE